MKSNYTLQDLWQLFLTCAFPFHFWAILMSLQDIEWVAKRTNFEDAIGVISYAMIFAFFESFIIFLFVVFLSTLILSQVEPKKRLAIMSVLIIIVTFLAIMTQLYMLKVWKIPNLVVSLLIQNQNPLRYIYLAVLVFIGISTFLSILLIYRNEKTLNLILEIINRFSLLVIFYLFLDFVALVIIIVRNI